MNPARSERKLRSDRILAVIMDTASKGFPAPALMAMGDGSLIRKVFTSEDDRRAPHASEFVEWFARADVFAAQHDFLAEFAAKEQETEARYQRGEIDMLEYLRSAQWETHFVD